MHPNKSMRFARRKLMLAAILLLACVLLLVTATWARYRTDEVSYLDYAAKSPDAISVWAAGSGGWSFSGGTGSLSFCVSSDTDGTDSAASTQQVSVRLLVSLSIAELEGENVRLSVKDGTDTTTCTAVAVPITEGTSLYKTFGAGRVYIFQDEDGKELSWTLAVGTDSVLSAQLEITGLNKPENPALLQLQVVGG